jgi:pseudouridine synthase
LPNDKSVVIMLRGDRMERLQKVIANSGYTSRRKAEDLIVQGKVKVNGEIVKELGVKVTSKDMIEVEGHILQKESKVYFLLYKPKGMVCTMHDEHNRSCVADLFSEIPERVYPVGRLDYDSTGLLMMTNDGEFANLMMHPRSHLEKAYEVTIDGLITGEQLHQLETGVFLDGIKTLPCKIRVIGKDLKHETTMLTMRIMEGKNRQIRRMFELVGYKVKRLHRYQYGCLDLKGLTPGTYRRIKPQEIKLLKHAVTKGK